MTCVSWDLMIYTFVLRPYRIDAVAGFSSDVAHDFSVHFRVELTDGRSPAPSGAVREALTEQYNP
ncbi:MAG: hypothetical protein U5K79_05320 [Cyclobacteriaceae bacterium]|nr:hypothetical protein [Cyclobacteriaceae bacterium]